MKKAVFPVLFAGLCIASLFVGVTDIRLADLLQDTDKLYIFLNSRLPRLISVLLVGAGMSVAGVVMQSISGNRFVSPTTAGTLDFTKLGVLVAIMLFPAAQMGIKLLIAFAFALLGTWLFMFIVNKIKLKDSIFVPLVGIMFGNIVSAVTTFIGYRYDLIQNINSWMQGRFTLIITGRYELVLLGIPVLILVYIYANRFTIAGMGDNFAHNLGLNYRRIVNVGLILCSLMSAAIVVTVGSIPFIGVIVPNLVSMHFGDNMRKSLPYTAFIGAAFVLVCDIISRVIIYPYEIPISVTTGTIGSAIFLYMILKPPKKKVAHAAGR